MELTRGGSALRSSILGAQLIRSVRRIERPFGRSSAWRSARLRSSIHYEEKETKSAKNPLRNECWIEAATAVQRMSGESRSIRDGGG